MTTLAQTFLENRDGVETQWDFWLKMKLGIVDPSIVPDYHKHEIPPAGETPIDLTAQRFVFNECLDDLYSLSTEQLKLTTQLLLESVHLPHKSTWIEWTAAKTPRFKQSLKIGVLFDTREDDAVQKAPTGHFTKSKVAIAMVAGDGGRAGCYHVGAIDDLPFPVGRTHAVKLGWTADAPYDGTPAQKRQSQEDDFVYVVVVALFGLFLLQQPKIVNVKDVIWDGKLQKARLKKNKLPLLEYQKVNVLIGKPETRYRNSGRSSNEKSDGVSHRKYHFVDGHFRTFHRGTEKQRVTWVDTYPRGDPKLGVIFKERHIKNWEPPK